jgi:cytochrome c-type biogenesis protein CcsB
MLNTTLFNAAMALYLCATLPYAIYLGHRKSSRVGVAATTVALLGFLVNTGALAVRWVESYKLGFGYVPLSNMYESMVFFAWAIMLIYLLIEYHYKIKELGVLASPLCALSIAVVSFGPTSSELSPLVPALQSNWLTSHVVTCFVGYAAFAVAFAASVALAIKSKGWARTLPEVKELDHLAYVSVTVGFPFLTLGILTGAIWANSAWGTYWSWDPKETWSLITWFVYAAYLHVRYSPAWKAGQRAMLGVTGFGVVLFTYWGVNFLLSGQHAYN